MADVTTYLVMAFTYSAHQVEPVSDEDVLARARLDAVAHGLDESQIRWDDAEVRDFFLNGAGRAAFVPVTAPGNLGKGNPAPKWRSREGRTIDEPTPAPKQRTRSRTED